MTQKSRRLGHNRHGVLVWRYDPPRVEAHTTGTPTWALGNWRWRDDDGDLSATGATFLKAENTNISVGASGDVALDTNVRFRFIIDEENTGDRHSLQSGLLYSLNGGAATTISTTSDVVRQTATANYANLDSTTNHTLTAPTGTFEAGFGIEENANFPSGGVEVSQDNFCVFEVCMQFLSADLSDGDSIEIKCNPGSTSTRSFPTAVTVSVNDSANTNVNTNLEALTLSTFAASIALNVSVAAATAALTVSPLQASVALDRTVDANTASLTVTEHPATVNAATNVQAGVDALTLTEHPATIGTGSGDTEVLANTSALTLTELAADVNLDRTVSAATAALTLTGHPATVNAETNVAANTDALTLTELAATVSLDVNVQASAAALLLTELAATVNAATNVQASVAALTLTGRQATVELASSKGPTPATRRVAATRDNRVNATRDNRVNATSDRTVKA